MVSHVVVSVELVKTYKSLAEEAGLAVCQKSFEHGEGIAVNICVTVYAFSWRMLKP
jgi:hypothetical protein